MKNISIVCVLFMLLFGATHTVFSQEKGIQLTHHKGKRVKFLEEGKRIKVFTNSDEKYKGRYTIIDDETIQIKGHTIKLEDIYLIRKKNLFNRASKIVILGLGTTGIILGIASGGTFSLAIGVSFGIVSYLTGFIVPELFVKNLDSDRWSYKITTNSN